MSQLKDNLKKTFLETIHIDEIYEEEDKIITYTQDFLKSIGITSKLDSFRNIIAYRDGVGESVLLNTHLDTPENVPNLEYTIKGDIIRSTGKSILGADPKSGLAVLLELARYLQENKIKTCPIELVFTRGEETGLYGALNLDYSLLKSKTGLVLDEDGPCTNLVIKAPGFYRLDAKIIGKIVHPRDWKDGINALEIAAKALSKFKQGEIVKGVTCNVGMLKAGTARNTVPGIVELKAELRSFDMKKLKEQGKRVESILKAEAKKKGAKVEIDSTVEFESYTLDKSHPLFKKLKACYKALKLKPNYYPTFGGSDANVINSHGIRVVPMGSGYYLAHQYTEYVNLAEMEELTMLLLEFVKK